MAAAPAAHGGRINILAIGERPSGHDEYIAAFFCDVRRALGLPITEVARRLSTPVHVIEALETGTLTALPDWSETERVVIAYAAALQVDPRPLLDRIRAQRAPVDSFSSYGYAAEERRSAALGPTARARRNSEPTPRRRRGRRRAQRMFLAVSAPMIALATGVWLAQSQPPLVMAAIDALPPVVSRSMRAGLEAIMLQTAPRRDGLRWIEVDDPRTRKADRLPTR